MKKNEELILVNTCMEFENILSERRQLQKTTYLTLHLYRMSRLGKSTEIETRLVVA